MSGLKPENQASFWSFVVPVLPPMSERFKLRAFRPVPRLITSFSIVLMMYMMRGSTVRSAYMGNGMASVDGSGIGVVLLPSGRFSKNANSSCSSVAISRCDASTEAVFAEAVSLGGLEQSSQTVIGFAENRISPLLFSIRSISQVST